MSERKLPPSHFERIGGAAQIRRLVERFYALMDELPEAREIRAMHPASLDNARERLYKFLCGWMGGPQLFVNDHGPPMLRRRHLHFSIGTAARDQWMMCMNRALEEIVDDPVLRTELAASFAKVADHMRNQPS